MTDGQNCADAGKSKIAQEVRELTEKLTSRIAIDEKLSALKRLGELGPLAEEAVPVMIEHIDNSEIYYACHRTLIKIGKISPNSVVPHAINRLNQILEIEKKMTENPPPLRISDSDRIPRQNLGRAIIILLSNFISNKQEFFDLLKKTIDVSPDMERHAIQYLSSSLGDQAIDFLLQIAGDEKRKSYTRNDAIYLLGLNKSAKAIPLLVKLMQGGDSDGFATSSAKALAEIGDKSISKDIWRIMKSNEGWNSKFGIDGNSTLLANTATPDIFDELVEKLKTEDFSLRLSVIRALGASKNKNAVEPLLATPLEVGNSPPFVQIKCTIAEALGELGPIDDPILSKRVDDYLKDMLNPYIEGQSLKLHEDVKYRNELIPAYFAYRLSALKAIAKIYGDTAIELLFTELAKGGLGENQDNITDILSAVSSAEMVNEIHRRFYDGNLDHSIAMDALEKINKKISTDDGRVMETVRGQDLCRVAVRPTSGPILLQRVFA